MRELLFRGIRKDNKKWAYGFCVVVDNKPYIFTGKMGLSQVTAAHRLMYRDFERYEVIPETVGEYTGLADRNGMKIYEGDIIHYDPWDSDHKIALFKGYWGLLNDGGEATELFVAVENGDVEIIGSIHDSLRFLAGIS